MNQKCYYDRGSLGKEPAAILLPSEVQKVELSMLLHGKMAFKSEASRILP